VSKKECKGLYYRKWDEHYISKGDNVVEKTSMSMLKRLSCKGCEECDWLKSAIKEELKENLPLRIYEKDYNPGDLYQLKYSWIGDDDWELYFDGIPMTESELKNKLEES